MSFPLLYKANETDFNHLGLGVLDDAISCLVTEERNGLFELEMEYPITGSQFDELKNDRLIKCDAGHRLKDQRFKIIRVSKPMKGIVTVNAEHISYLAQDLALKPDVPFSGNASVALGTWATSIVDAHPFTVYSDISTTAKGMWGLAEVENARRALGGVAGSILDNYGGEYRFDNYHIGLYAQRGSDSGALIAYGRNLTDLTQEEAIDSTYTSIYPYAIIQDENDKEKTITLPEYYVDSGYVGNFARRKILKVDFSEEEITTVAALRTRAVAYMKANDFGIPKVNLKIEFADLSQSLDSETVQLLEVIELCDLVTVYFEEFDIQTKAKIIRTKWNPLLDRYDSIEAGEARASLSKSIDSAIDVKVEAVTQRVNKVQNAANGKNKVYRGPETPVGDIKKNDLWYKPVGNGEIEMYIHDGSMWKLEKYSGDQVGGTINFANVNGINFNAANIVTGSLDTHLVKIVGEENLFYWDGEMLKAISRADARRFVELSSDGLYAARGSLSVERPDGFVTMNNGMSVFDVSIQGASPPFKSDGVEVFGWWYRSNSLSEQSCDFFTFRHTGRYLKMMLGACADQGGRCTISIERGSEGQGNREILATYSTTSSDRLNELTLTVDLGIPDGSRKDFYLRVKTNNADYNALVRIRGQWLEG